MVSNKTEFNNKFPKESKQIELRRQRNFQGSLVIDDYLELESLNLRDIKSIEQITLQNLPSLQEVTIWNCGVKELLIENCPQIKKIIARTNCLTNLNFLLNLENLAELEISGNNQLSEFLKPYEDNKQKIKQKNLKDLRKIYQLFKANKSLELIKEFGQSNQNREDLKKQIASLLKDREKFATTSQPINTKELVLNLNQEFQAKEEKIKYLELRAQELTESSKEQRNKIIGSFLRLLPEKELVQELINLRLEFVRFKKQAIDEEDYEERVEEYEEKNLFLKKQLRSKLNKEIVKDTMNKIQSILTDCEQLAEQELELENKLANKSVLISNQKQNNEAERKIIEQNNEMQQKQLEELANLKTMLKELKSDIVNLKPEEDLITKLINALKAKPILIQNDTSLLDKLNELLGVKRMFLNSRQQTITKLQATCDLLEEANIGKYARIEEASKALAASGKLVGNWLPLNIIEPIGEGSSVLNSRQKRKFAIKNSQAFQQLLTEESKNLTLIKEVYQQLLTSLPNLGSEEEPSLFSLRYKIYEVATNLWKDKKHLESSDMKEAISLLQTNLLDLQDELKAQEQSLAKFNQEQTEALVVVPTSRN